ncbi:interleukin-17F-like [Eublepharis macularius]|uniref:Interleukin-17F-like n=1 Tax=Eublepharis macularius TaxID=481883 RepID=A0AA97KGX9_EUBMA|nr:interleukin-17F-like [Eublepharis macularius]
MMARSPKRLSSLIKRLVLVLALINSVYGNSKKFKESPPGEQWSDDCPTHENSEFPDSVRVKIHIVHTNPGNTKSQDVRNRSLSPWDYRINEDPNRFPYAIAEASCRYTACVDGTGRGLNYGLSSVPIQQEILVLKRKQAGCQQTYWLEKQLVTVGCTCTFPTTSTYRRKNAGNYKDLTRTSHGLKQ